MRKIKTSKKLAVSAFALAASAMMMFPSNVFAAHPGYIGVPSTNANAVWIYTNAEKKVLDTTATGAYYIAGNTDGAIGTIDADAYYYFKEGKYDNDYTGLAKVELAKSGDTTLKYVYFKDGAVDTTFSGVVDGYYVYKGEVKSDEYVTGIVRGDASKNDDKTTLYYVKDSAVVTNKTGVVASQTISAVADETKDTYPNIASASSYSDLSEIFYVKNGVVDASYNGFVTFGNKLLYAKGGRVVTATADSNYNLAVRPYGDKYVLTVQETLNDGTNNSLSAFTVAAPTSTTYGAGTNLYNGIARNPMNGTYWYVTNDYVDFRFNNLALAATGDALVTDTATTGVANGELVKFTNGQYIKDYTGFGLYDNDLTDATPGKRYFMVNGKVGTKFSYNVNNGIAYLGSVRPLGDKNNTWAYIDEAPALSVGPGSLSDAGYLIAADKTVTNAIGVNPNNGTKWAVRDGVVDFNYTGVVAYGGGKLAMAVNGQIDEDYTGFGTLEVTTGLTSTLAYYYFEDGEVAVDVTGVRPLGDENNTWVYVKNGRVDFDYTYYAENPRNKTLWIVENGIVRFDYTGAYQFPTDANTVYEVVNGQVLGRITVTEK